MPHDSTMIGMIASQIVFPLPAHQAYAAASVSQVDKFQGVEQSRRRIRAKMEAVQREVPAWLASGGDPADVVALGERVGPLMENDRPERAQALLDEILVKVRRGPLGDSTPSSVSIIVYDARGNPLPRAEIIPRLTPLSTTVGVYPLDASYNPVPLGIAEASDGKAVLAKPLASPLILSYFPKVPGFGQVRVYADNGGRGYLVDDGRPWTIDLPLEAAKSRIEAVRLLIASHEPRAFGKGTIERLESAERYMALPAASNAQRAKQIYLALNHALWAGELATLDAARYEIAKKGRREFLFGGFLSHGFSRRLKTEGAEFAKVFNFATIKEFFLKSYEYREGITSRKEAQKQLAWLESEDITAKGHPLIYLVDINIPPWLQGKDCRKLQDANVRRLRRELERFKGRIKVWDVVNEGHINTGGCTQSEMIELTKKALKITREIDPDATRVINVSWPAGDYVLVARFGRLVREGMVQTPYKHLKALVTAGADFEAVGIQMYYQGLDLMELSRQLDRFGALGKRVHITEVGASSAIGPDPASRYFRDPNVALVGGEWRRPWDEATQAQWLEGLYTVAYSKPYVDAITWVDMPDDFWPYGGLFHRDMTPKAAWTTLCGLLRSWELGNKRR